MPTLFSPMLALALLAQPGRASADPKVVDEQGRPVAGAHLVYYGLESGRDNLEPIVVRATTDSAGKYHLRVPAPRGTPAGGPSPWGGRPVAGPSVWVCRPDRGITALSPPEVPHVLVLHPPERVSVKVEGPNGVPVAGVRLSTRALATPSRRSLEAPESLAEEQSVVTGPDGIANLAYLGKGHRLLAVRVSHATIGTQDVPIDRPWGSDPEKSPNTIRLKSTTRLNGRLVESNGRPVADHPVEAWSKGGAFLSTAPIQFSSGPIRTGDDGSFETPANLLVGSTYRIVVRNPRMAPALSDWIKVSDKPCTLPPLVQRPLRTITGKVIDRQGKPLSNVEVFQSGDGPDRTYTKTDFSGRFSLAGFHQGPVFVFARGAGYRFFGRMVKASDSEITVTLTRSAERPDREMRALPDAIPLDESRALSRRLIEPYWKTAVEKKDVDAQARAIRVLAWADPAAALRWLATIELAHLKLRSGLQRHIAQCLAWTVPAQAEAVAATISDPAEHAAALVAIVDLLPDNERANKVRLLDAAAAQPSSATDRYAFLLETGEIGERYFELGEIEKARSEFAVGTRLLSELTDKKDKRRSQFIARLARVDLPAALALAREYPAPRVFGDLGSTTTVLLNIANHLAADNPAETERLLHLVPPSSTLQWLSPRVVWQMAKTDPARARALIDERQTQSTRLARDTQPPMLYLFLALSAKSHGRKIVDEAVQAAMQGIDQRWVARIPLPVVEEIDPALVPELFWRAASERQPIGNPYENGSDQLADAVFPLAWYDRDVATVAFAPLRARIGRADDDDLASWTREFVAFSLIDPRAAVARLERVPVPANLDSDTIPSVRFARAVGGPNGGSARLRVAELLAMTREQRLRELWGQMTLMRSLFDRDF